LHAPRAALNLTRHSMDSATFFQRHCAVDRGADSLFLPDWTTDDWAALLRHARPVHLAAGQALIRTGERDRALYLVASGLLEVSGSASRSEALGRLYRESPGAVVGEISFFDGLPRSASVWAVQPAELLRVDPEGLRAFQAAHPAQAQDFLFALGRVLAFRVRRGEDRQRRGSSGYAG
jgi:CRP/FNR family cyclic AMP-dependent transcriptional regulator